MHEKYTPKEMLIGLHDMLKRGEGLNTEEIDEIVSAVDKMIECKTNRHSIHPNFKHTKHYEELKDMYPNREKINWEDDVEATSEIISHHMRRGAYQDSAKAIVLSCKHFSEQV